jgi:hypothetical protein
MTASQAVQLLLGVAMILAGGCGIRRLLRRFDRHATRHIRDLAAPVRIEDMPRHPEWVPDPDDPAADGGFDDIADRLMDDGMYDIAEKLGWLE